MIALGSKVNDIITGFTGIVTGRVEYISGCNQCLVTPKVGSDGDLKSPQWFDEQRIAVWNDAPVKLENGANPGFDCPAPTR